MICYYLSSHFSHLYSNEVTKTPRSSVTSSSSSEEEEEEVEYKEKDGERASYRLLANRQSAKRFRDRRKHEFGEMKIKLESYERQIALLKNVKYLKYLQDTVKAHVQTIQKMDDEIRGLHERNRFLEQSLVAFLSNEN